MLQFQPGHAYSTNDYTSTEVCSALFVSFLPGVPLLFPRIQAYVLPVFLLSGANTGVRNYHKIYGISSVIHGKFMACFSIVSMGKQAINFAECAIMIILSRLN